MGFKCQHCGWKPKSSDFYDTSEVMEECRDHELICPVKPRKEYTGEY